MTPAPLLYDFDEVAGRLRVSGRGVRRLVAAGALPTVMVAGCRRIHHEDLVAYAASLRHDRTPRESA